MRQSAGSVRADVLSLVVLAAVCLGLANVKAVGPVQTIDVRTRDFAFEAPDTVRAGLTRLRLVNRGQELHHLQLMRIEEGHEFREFQERVAAGARLPEWAVPVGGPGVPGTQASEVTLRLDAGTYAMICLIPSPNDGKSHFRKGMVHQLVVTPSGFRESAQPVPSLYLRLDDYAFITDSTLPAGRHVMRVENTGSQAHEVVIVRLAKGKTPEDFLAWASKLSGPPPGTPSGGTTEIAPGGVNLATLDLAPGEYALVCFAHDEGDSQSHAMRGMVRRIRVI